MSDCITPLVAASIATKDTSRMLGQIAKALAINSPFVNVLDGGVLPAGVSDTIRASIQEQALPGDSLVNPTFTATKDIVGAVNAGLPWPEDRRQGRLCGLPWQLSHG